MKADEKVATTIEDKEAARKCKAWLGMAENYIRAGKKKAAVPYLKKVIERYGNTKYAEQARTLLEATEGNGQ